MILEGGVNESLACKGKGKRTNTGPRCFVVVVVVVVVVVAVSSSPCISISHPISHLQPLAERILI